MEGEQLFRDGHKTENSIRAKVHKTDYLNNFFNKFPKLPYTTVDNLVGSYTYKLILFQLHSYTIFTMLYVKKIHLIKVSIKKIYQYFPQKRTSVIHVANSR